MTKFLVIIVNKKMNMYARNVKKNIKVIKYLTLKKDKIK